MLTPQLQQAIRLLQLSTQDLALEIQEALENNPLLEVKGDHHDITVSKQEDIPLTESKVIVDETPVEHYASEPVKRKTANNEFNLENVYATATTLCDYIKWQLELTPMSNTDFAIGLALIDAISDSGLLNQTIDDIQLALKQNGIEVSLDEIEAVRHLMLRFDPLGVAATSLEECLLVQLEELKLDDSTYHLTTSLIQDDLESLAQHNYAKLLKKYRINESCLNDALNIIKRLHPQPGELIAGSKTEYIVPDVIVRKERDQWLVRLNQDSLPNLSINHQYASLITAVRSSSDNRFIKNNLQEAKWFLKSLQSRQDTLLKVSMCIIEEQTGFLELGEEAIKPLILNDIAQKLDMHESTISRITTQKYIHTPRGIYELKYFFSSHLSTSSGEELSSKAIRAHIKKLISKENSQKPLSDSKIAQILNNEGIHIARRTVTKYRKSLGIGSSSERKSLRS